MEIQVIAATTDDAITGSFDAAGYEWIIVHAYGLATTENVSISTVSGGVSVPVNNESGTAQQLTATIRQLRLEGGIHYIFEKSETASPCAVFVTPGDAKER